MGTLYIVASPIGNLEDITLRAIRILREVDLIYCEDTRVTKILLEKYDVAKKPLRSLNARDEKAKTKELINEVLNGKDVAYVSDAGTPGISDPGVYLVRQAQASGIDISPVPGVSALTAALSVAGVPTETFTFYGFLPQKKGRQKFLANLVELRHTAVFYESTHRILKLLSEMSLTLPDREIVIVKELTKIHEAVLRGTPEQLLEILEREPGKEKGEFVIIVPSV